MNRKVVSIAAVTVLSATLLSGCNGSGDAAADTSAAGSQDVQTSSESEESQSVDSESDKPENSEPTEASGSSEEKDILDKYPSAAKDADTLVVALSADPRALDPAYADDAESARVIAQIYEGLLRYDEESMEVLPCLAKSWEISDDNLVYTFHLQQGVKFQDGTDFNAEAVKYNIDRQTVNKSEGMSYADFVFGYVKECRVVDTDTVEIELKSPCMSFLSSLAMPLAAPVVSPAACEENDNNVSEMPVGTGPYSFVRWEKKNKVILERNENYREEAANIKTLVFQTIGDLTERVEALTAGGVDITADLDSNAAEQIEDTDCEMITQDGMNTSYMAYNTEKLTDPAVRHALSQAVDVEEVTETLYGEYAEPADTILPSTVPGYSDSVAQTEYDFEESSMTFVKNSTIPFVHIITYVNARPYNTATGQKLAEEVQGYLDQVGVIASIDTYEWDEYREKLAEGDYDICFYGWSGDNGDADNFLSLFSSQDTTMNVARYQNEDYNVLLSQAAAAEDAKERKNLYQRAEQILADADAVLPISHQKILCGHNPKLSGITINPAGYIDYSRITKET